MSPTLAALTDPNPVRATLAGFGFGEVDEYGTRFTLADEDGWYGSPGLRRDSEARPYAAGTFTAQGYADGRSIVLSGKGFATDQASGTRSIRRLRALLADGGSAPLTWYDEDSLILTARVQRDSDVKVRWLSHRIFSWQMVVFAPDPRVYGEATTLPTSLPGGGGGLTWPVGSAFDFGEPGSSGTVAFLNDGTAATEPLFTITGPMAQGFQITYLETGERLRYEAPVGTPVLLDCFEGTCTTEGQDREVFLTVSEWFSVQAGASASFQFATLGGETATDPARMDATLAPAYN